MKETMFGTCDGYIRITNVNPFINLTFIGTNQKTEIYMKNSEAQKLIEEMSRILEGEE